MLQAFSVFNFVFVNYSLWRSKVGAIFLAHSENVEYKLKDQITWMLDNSDLSFVRRFKNSLFQDPYAKKFLKDVKTTKTSYIANSGGILGLCMGFSFISGAEVIFHFLSSIFPSLSAGKGGVPTRKASLDQDGQKMPGEENPAIQSVRKCPKHGCKLTRKKCHILRGRAGFPSCFKRGNPSHRVTKYPIYGPERFIWETSFFPLWMLNWTQ